jgi:hypothetical protein
MRASWVVAGVLTGVFALAGSSAATATATPAPARPGSAVTYDLAFRPQGENYVDIGTPGPGVGDLLVFQDRVLSRGRQVGVQGGSCTITALLPDGFQTFCTGTVLFADGQVAFQGLVTDKPEKRMAVVGGTGRYRDAGGELTVVELGENEAGTLTIRLR